MSTDPTTRAPSYGLGRRDVLRTALLDALARATLADDKPFNLRTRELTDPAVALLDAWATIGDVIGLPVKETGRRRLAGRRWQPRRLAGRGWRPRRLAGRRRRPRRS